MDKQKAIEKKVDAIRELLDDIDNTRDELQTEIMEIESASADIITNIECLRDFQTTVNDINDDIDSMCTMANNSVRMYHTEIKRLKKLVTNFKKSNKNWSKYFDRLERGVIKELLERP